MSHQTLTVRKLKNPPYRAVLATEYPVIRHFGVEIIEISRSAINFERFPLPVILSHKHDSLPVGVAMNPRIEDKQLVADIFNVGIKNLCHTLIDYLFQTFIIDKHCIL